MKRDTLYILRSNFTDDAYPDTQFYCWTCVLMEGLLAVFPELLDKIDVKRVEFPRPRVGVVSLVGEKNQSLPTLVLASDAPEGLETGEHEGVRFVKGKDNILNVLSARHGIPIVHP